MKTPTPPPLLIDSRGNYERTLLRWQDAKDGDDLEVEEAGRDRWETQETPGRARRKTFGWMEGKQKKRGDTEAGGQVRR